MTLAQALRAKGDSTVAVSDKIAAYLADLYTSGRYTDDPMATLRDAGEVRGPRVPRGQ